MSTMCGQHSSLAKTAEQPWKQQVWHLLSKRRTWVLNQGKNPWSSVHPCQVGAPSHPNIQLFSLATAKEVMEKDINF